MTEQDPELPEDWRDRDDGLELLIAALVRAYARRDDVQLTELIAVGGEMAKLGAFEPARAVASIGISYVLGTPLEAVVPTQLGDLDTMLARARLVRTDALPSALASLAVEVVAFVVRRQGNLDEAVGLYRDAAAIAEASGQPLRAARTLQSLGALLYEADRSAEAEAVTSEARDRFTGLGDDQGAVATALNLVEYAVVDEQLEVARRRLDEIERPVRELRDSHFYASWIARMGTLDILEGDKRAGRAKLHQALRSAHARGDVEIEIAVLGYLAQAARSEGRRSQAARYAERAYATAEASGDPALISSSAYEFAVDLAELDEFEEALSLLDRAAETAVGLQQVRVRSDRAAVLISRALAEPDLSVVQGDGPGPGAWLREAEEVLLALVPDLLDGADEWWASRAVRNLRVVWLATEEPARGADILRDFAAKESQRFPVFGRECLRLSGLLAMSAGFSTTEVISRLRAAAAISYLPNSDRAAVLLEYASVAEHSYREFEVAFELYEDALRELRSSGDIAIYGNALNDSALVASSLENETLALDRLREAASIASGREDRVLGSLVALNTGELLVRAKRRRDARRHFELAATQAEAVGDLERAAVSLASWANTFVNDEGDPDLDFARGLAERARGLAELASSDDALARATSALASLSFAVGDLSAAYELWGQARDLAAPRRRPAYEGFLLETLARQRDWAKFSRQMDRFAKSSQKHETQLLFAEGLWPSANVWLRHGDVSRAAKVLAYSVLLAGEGHSGLDRSRLFEDETALRRDGLLAAVRALAYAGNLLSMDVIPVELRERLKPELVKALVTHGAARADALKFIDFIEEFVGDDDA